MNITERLNQYFEDLASQNLFSGVVLVTQGKTELYAGAFGFASRAWKIRNTLDTRFDTASVTKLFTAIATLQLIDQGRLAFDTPVVDFLGLQRSAISREVNIFHLLTHSSGIGDDSEEEDGENYADLWKEKANYSVTTTADFLPQFIHKPANFPPGQGCRYCNCSFILLGLVIEKISELPYREYVKKHIFEKVGMASSDFLRLDRVNHNLAEGSDPIHDEPVNLVGWKKNIYSFPPVGSPDSGAHVTAGDLDRFLRAVLAGDLLSPELTESLTTPQVYYRDTKRGRLMFSYVLEFLLDQSGQVIYFQKDGVNAGVSAIIRHFPASDINVILLSNMEQGVWKPVWEIHELVMAGAFAGM